MKDRKATAVIRANDGRLDYHSFVECLSAEDNLRQAIYHYDAAGHSFRFYAAKKIIPLLHWIERNSE